MSDDPWADCDPRCRRHDDCTVATTCRARRHDVQQRAAEVIEGLPWEHRRDDDKIAAALAAAGLLVDPDTARLVKLGRAVELMREAMLRDTGRVDAGYRVYLDAIYREAEQP